MRSSNVAWQYGISGPFWYASGATIQILLFGILAVEIKRKAPNAHTMLEIIRARWGNTAHKVRCVCDMLRSVLTARVPQSANTPPGPLPAGLFRLRHPHQHYRLLHASAGRCFRDQRADGHEPVSVGKAAPGSALLLFPPAASSTLQQVALQQTPPWAVARPPCFLLTLLSMPAFPQVQP